MKRSSEAHEAAATVWAAAPASCEGAWGAAATVRAWGAAATIRDSWGPAAIVRASGLQRHCEGLEGCSDCEGAWEADCEGTWGLQSHR